MYLLFMSSIWSLNFSRQLSHASLGQNGCSTANAPTESNIAESSEPFGIGVQFTSSLLYCLTQAQSTAIRIWHYAIYSTFGKAQWSLFKFLINLVAIGIPYATDFSLTSSQRRHFITIFLGYFCQFCFFAVVVSEGTTTSYVGRNG